MRIILSLMEVLWCHMGIILEAYGGYLKNVPQTYGSGRAIKKSVFLWKSSKRGGGPQPEPKLWGTFFCASFYASNLIPI